MKTHKVRPVLIKSKEPTNIALFPNNKLFWTNSEGIPQELILISLEDEKIEVGDEFYCSDRTNYAHLFTCSGHTDNAHLQVKSDNEYGYGDWAICYSKKVIARQSQIPPEYISKFIEQYNNGSVEDLEIEMEEANIKDVDKCKITFNYKPKLTNGFITIVEKEPITYTEEEVKTFLYNLRRDMKFSDDFSNSFIKKWFEQNKKK